MNNEEYLSRSPEDTKAYAAKLAHSAKPGDIICLCGNLGAGKTAFAQGFAKGLNTAGYVNSPTFTIMQVYDGKLPIYHFDLYRLAPEFGKKNEIPIETLDDIDFFEYLEGDGVTLIEWAEYAKENIPEHAVWIEIEQHDDNTRIIRRR